MESWYLCQANFIYPCLALLSTPVIFLVLIFLFSGLGVGIAFKKKTTMLNSIVLSVYPFLFHICFMIFYWSKDNQILVIAEIACLAIFSLGSMHHCLTLIYELIMFFVKVVKELCLHSRNKVKPTNDKKDEEVKEEPILSKSRSIHKSEKEEDRGVNVVEEKHFAQMLEPSVSSNVKIKPGGSFNWVKGLIVKHKMPWR